jgi:hypothetical protein
MQMTAGQNQGVLLSCSAGCCCWPSSSGCFWRGQLPTGWPRVLPYKSRECTGAKSVTRVRCRAQNMMRTQSRCRPTDCFGYSTDSTTSCWMSLQQSVVAVMCRKEGKRSCCPQRLVNCVSSPARQVSLCMHGQNFALKHSSSNLSAGSEGDPRRELRQRIVLQMCIPTRLHQLQYDAANVCKPGEAWHVGDYTTHVADEACSYLCSSCLFCEMLGVNNPSQLVSSPAYGCVWSCSASGR